MRFLFETHPEKFGMCYSCKTFIEKYIAFGFKFQQHTGVHEPNLCCAEDFKGNNYTFQNLDDFCKWLISNKHKDYTAIAHYGKKYISDVYEQQGITLDKDKIQENPSLRAIAKLRLNSLWGKFGQRNNLTKTKCIMDKGKYFKILSDNKIKNLGIRTLDRII